MFTIVVVLFHGCFFFSSSPSDNLSPLFPIIGGAEKFNINSDRIRHGGEYLEHPRIIDVQNHR